MTEHTQPDAWKARAVRDPGGRLRWVVEDRGRPFALVVDDGTPETWRRLAVLCNAPIFARALNRLGDPDDPDIQQLRNMCEGHFLAKSSRASEDRIQEFLFEVMFVVRVLPRDGSDDDLTDESGPRRGSEAAENRPGGLG